MKNQIFAIILLCSTFPAFGQVGAANSNRYTLEDLQILEREKSSEEFLRHAKDIPPSKRNRRWSQLVINMTNHYLQKSKKRNEFSKSNMEFISNIVNWPIIQSNETSLKFAREYFLDYLDVCYSRVKDQGEQCYQETVRVWNRVPPNPQFGLELARMTKAKFPEKRIWSFLQHSAKSNFAEYYCSLPILKNEIIHIFLNNFADDNDESGLAIKVQEYISSNCLNHIMPELREIAFSNNESRSAAFWILKSFSAVDLVEEDLFLVQSLLLTPKKGDLLNLAWSRLIKLKGEPVRRIHVLERLKLTDPFPDTVFRSKDKEVSEVIAKHFENNFPEFWPLYFKKCFEFYSGKKKFPKGNPTPSCRAAGRLTSGSYHHSQKVHRILSGLKKK